MQQKTQSRDRNDVRYSNQPLTAEKSMEKGCDEQMKDTWHRNPSSLQHTKIIYFIMEGIKQGRMDGMNKNRVTGLVNIYVVMIINIS